MVVLDTTITNVAMPTIAGDLGVSTNEGTWIITAYAVAEAITVPLTGWLVQRFGQVRLSIFPENRSNVAISLWGLTTVIAPIFGPILGGYISDNYHWGWIFYINVFF